MGQLSVQRWQRFGHDRWYVNDEAGTSVGWMDARTGELHLDDEAMRPAVLEVLAPHMEDLDDTATPVPQPATAAPPPPPPSGPPLAPPAPQQPSPPPDQPYAVRVTHRDLGSQVAGQAVAEQAQAAREAAPVKTLVARVLGVHTEERAWRVGAQGEKKVAARLARLPEGWHVLHAVPVGNRGSDIDHVVIGPAGVFTINAKHHPNANVWVGGNTFMVNGRKVPYVRNSRHEAQRASRLLSEAAGREVKVRGVIAVVGAHKGFTVKEQPSDVTVVTRKRLARWLQDQRAWLPLVDVEDLHSVARRSDTWQSR